MAWAQVGSPQSTFNISVVTSVALTRTAGTIGNLLIVWALNNDRTNPITVSDTDGNAWNICNPDFNDSTNNTRMQSWFAYAKSTNSTTVTVQQGGVTAGFWSMSLEEFSGNDTVSALDQVNHSVAGASGTPTSGAIVPSVNDCLIWAACADTITAVGNIDGSAATKGADDTQGDWTEYRFLTGRGGISMTAGFTGSGGYNAFVASFKQPGAASSDLSASVGEPVVGGSTF